MTKSILFVFTSCNKTLTGNETGWYLPEAAHPYYTLAPDFEIDFAAPKGPNPPVDAVSVQMFKDDESQKFLTDPKVQSLFANAKALKDVNYENYAAIFYVGGHGPVIDLASDPVNIELASKFYQSGKIVSAVCHGPAALVGVKGTDGKNIFAGKKATAFTRAEEEQVGKVKDIPFVPEDKMVELGAVFEKASEPWGVKVSVDGTLLTGQNPASAKPLGELIAQTLKSQA
ncbi:class I glutamine amidotransferase-like protein [Stereum hirsutum FP-91666 SS1]|uniref:class I glutamine amidotransferase-like protein n=1 Tax=Stereum hirsutum (strain FP-91666) TaxID=721885 RepID=UPI000440E0A1|nr:class I glutamine amidotransferase-like protein [Stereum hirsutum FP-91666 SS1]EIM87503.1 class I glutamine amidotransferase-like protein [Stereum hirsutum FP-91666 SS1]